MQNVNLYLPEFRKKKHWLDAEKMVLVAGAAVLLMVVVSGIEYWQLSQLRADLAAKNQQQQDIAAATVALRDQYGVQTEDPALLENITELEADLNSKEALLTFLEGRDLGNTGGFSEHLADLSRYHVPGLSLSTVKLTDGGDSLELAGQVLRAELVTIYVQELDKGSSYAGMNFEMLQITEQAVAVSGEAEEATNPPGVWSFQVRSLKR